MWLDSGEHWWRYFCLSVLPGFVLDAVGGLFVAWRRSDGVPRWLVGGSIASLVIRAPVSRASPLGTDGVLCIARWPTWLWVEDGDW